MSHRIRSRSAYVFALIALAVTVTACPPPPVGPGPTTTTSTTTTTAPPDVVWGDTVDSLGQRGLNGSQFTIHCTAGGVAFVVWGTGPFTDDSSICTAAVFQGLITFAAGGNVTYKVAPGASSYSAGTQNGVTTEPYDSWPGSFILL